MTDRTPVIMSSRVFAAERPLRPRRGGLGRRSGVGGSCDSPAEAAESRTIIWRIVLGE